MSGKAPGGRRAWGTAADGEGGPQKKRAPTPQKNTDGDGWVRASEAVAPSAPAQQEVSARGGNDHSIDRLRGRYPAPAKLRSAVIAKALFEADRNPPIEQPHGNKRSETGSQQAADGWGSVEELKLALVDHHFQPQTGLARGTR